MQGRNLILLGVAVLIGIVAVILANAWFSGVEEKQQQIAEQQKLDRIVVATQPLEFAEPLTPQNLRLQNWPANSVPEGAFRSVADVLKHKRVALRPIVPGEPVLASKVSGTDGRATLAALLPDGMRAISIPINAVNGVSGFVLPGTMVDVLLTRQIEGDGASRDDQRADVLLQNVQVLAVDQMASSKEGKPKASKTATLAVTLADAQRLAIAGKLGTLSLALRKVESAAAEGDAPTGALSRTLTSRQLGVPRIVMGGRRGGGGGGGGNMPRSATINIVPQGISPASPGLMPAVAGPSMTVVRGTETTSYPIGSLGGSRR